MKLHIRSPQTYLKKSQTDYIERRTAFAFSRLKHFVEVIHITVEEVSLPVAGKDKECKIRIIRKGEAEIILVERQGSMRLAIDRALFRASYNLQRRIQRQQAMVSRSHIRQPQGGTPKGAA